MLGIGDSAMLEGARELRAVVMTKGRYPLRLLNRSTAAIDGDIRVRELRPPRLVVTSPTYPGVHVLYHRWQVDGRGLRPGVPVIDGRPGPMRWRGWPVSHRRPRHMPKHRLVTDGDRSSC
jgi:hypothetical protein